MRVLKSWHRWPVSKSDVQDEQQTQKVEGKCFNMRTPLAIQKTTHSIWVLWHTRIVTLSQWHLIVVNVVEIVIFTLVSGPRIEGFLISTFLVTPRSTGSLRACYRSRA